MKAMELGRREDREWRDENRRQAIVAGVSLICSFNQDGAPFGLGWSRLKSRRSARFTAPSESSIVVNSRMAFIHSAQPSAERRVVAPEGVQMSGAQRICPAAPYR